MADANERRDWRIYADFAHVLIRIARDLYVHDDFGLDLKNTAYAFDSTTIDLCLALFPWAQFRRRKGAVKLHTLIDLRGSIPCFIRISTGKLHDVRALDDLPIEPGAFYVMDRGYVDFARLHRFDEQKAFFITRAKRNMDYSRQTSAPVDRSTGLRSDQIIRLRGVKTSLDYPDALRRITFYDMENDKRLAFMTNHLRLPALTIAHLYRARWRVELFFKWIKQNLRIKAFYGYSTNAVKTQVWIAISVYVLVAILRKRLGIERSLTEILQILSVTILETTPVFEALTTNTSRKSGRAALNQLLLFNL
jgi:IS4 transposase